MKRTMRCLLAGALFLCLSAQWGGAAFWDSKKSSAQNPKKVSVSSEVWSRGPMNNPRLNAQSHWEKHKEEFPELRSVDAYMAKAHEFYQNPPKGTLKKRKINREIMHYHSPSNTFAVYSSRGVPQTLFRPRSKIAYWNRQEGETVK